MMTERQFSLSHPSQITSLWRLLFTVLLIIVAVAITLTGFFSPELPLWLAGLPLMAAIVAGTALARAIAMTSFLLWPIIASASALVTLVD